ncbi:murein biosynthesis integral membrane protein MurJ [bacterium]|nr:murein biosynthesis integral membrane protein MurJ [bacterium]
MSFFGKKSILKNMAGIGSLSLLSKFLGIIREILMVRFLGVGSISDAFITAYKLPNSLRKIFAEGALSAAMIPTLVSVMHTEGKSVVNRLMSLAFLVFEGMLLGVCALVVWKASFVINVVAPGFTPLQVSYAVPFLQILMPFIFFLSSSALLAGALQSVRHFFIPAFSPVLLNIVFISSLIICINKSFPVEYLCLFILLGGFIQLLLHIVTYLRLGFRFGKIDKQAIYYFKKVMIKFLPCLLSMSIMELGLIVDTAFASYLPAGSVSLVYYANRFMGIPLSVFAVSFSTVLLPHFSRVFMYAPKRVSFYLLEAAKFVFWVTIPSLIIMMLFSEKLFSTLFQSKKFSALQVSQAGMILSAFLIGLFFFSFNKILLNIYYAKHNTWIPTLVTLISVGVNITLNFVLIRIWYATGLALATSITFGLQVILLTWLLQKKFGIKLYLSRFFKFVYHYCLQMFVVFGGVFGLYRLFGFLIAQTPAGFANFFLNSLGFWLWVGPLIGFGFFMLFLTRKIFKVRVYFLD